MRRGNCGAVIGVCALGLGLGILIAAIFPVGALMFNTSTLADMWVECSCGARRSMSGATQHENFEGMKCSGHHPFRPNHKNEKCDKEMIPSQRGASNVYFPVMRSAISIPPWINPLYNLIDVRQSGKELTADIFPFRSNLPHHQPILR